MTNRSINTKKGKSSIRTKLLLAFLSLAVFTGITGGIGAYYTNYVGSEGLMVGKLYAPLVDAAMEIKLEATTAHLFFEEILAGDSNESIDDVWSKLNNAIWYCDAILQGGKNDEGQFFASKDPLVIDKIKLTKQELTAFVKSAKSRHSIGSFTAGSANDQQFDIYYEKLQAFLGKVMNESNHTRGSSTLFHAGQARYLLANGHLFFEELLSGDTEVKFEHVTRDFSKAREHVGAICLLPGKGNVKPLLLEIDEFIKTTKKRYQSNLKKGGAGSEADQQFDVMFESFITTADQAETQLQRSMAKGLDNLKGGNQHAFRIMIGITCLGFLLAIILGLIITFQITNPIRLCVNLANAIAEGDFTRKISITSNDELGMLANSFNQLTDNLRQLMLRVRDTGLSITSACSEIVSSSKQQASGASEQAASVAETSSTMSELSTTASKISQSAQEISNSSDMLTDSADETTKAVNMTRDMMSEIQDATDNSAKAILALGEKSKDIAQVIGSISDIADETKMLSLNASIEAVRAGEEGKAFSVVAMEIRSLAANVSKATVNIRELLNQIQTSANVAVIATEESSKRVDQGNQAIQKMQEQQENVFQLISSSSTLSKQINIATQQQTSASEQVVNSMQEIELVSKQSAVGANQSTASAEDLSQMAEELKQAISKFKLN